MVAAKNTRSRETVVHVTEICNSIFTESCYLTGPDGPQSRDTRISDYNISVFEACYSGRRVHSRRGHITVQRPNFSCPCNRSDRLRVNVNQSQGAIALIWNYCHVIWHGNDTQRIIKKTIHTDSIKEARRTKTASCDCRNSTCTQVKHTDRMVS